jgi:UDP-N-acetylglucosamine acyltransferase
MKRPGFLASSCFAPPRLIFYTRHAMPIHPTAIVSPKAELDSSVDVGPHAIIQDHVRIGAGTKIWANAFITGHTEIGRDNQIHMGAVIGHEPQDVRFDRSCRSYLKIGDRNIIREYVTIHRGTEPESATAIGDDNFLMISSHVAHNCVIGNRVIIANAALLGGHVQVGDRTFVSGGVVVHQFMRIGRLAMISGNARIAADVPPFLLIAERNEVHGLNLVGLKRAEISAEALADLKLAYKILFRSGLNFAQATKEAATLLTAEAREMVEFVRNSTNGVCHAPRD